MTLDAEQRAAAIATERRIRVLAGAGSGKTSTLTARVEHLLSTGVSPEKICAITFTRKAADELVSRIGALGLNTGGMQVGTIHALGLKILWQARRGWKVADESMRRKVVRRVLIDMREATRRPSPLMGPSTDAVKKWKTTGKLPQQRVLEQVCQFYQQSLRKQRLFDFDDLIIESNVALEHVPFVRGMYEGRWDHILVDEVQDTDYRQWQLIRKLVVPQTNLYVVGDISQSIYGFRGARPDLIIRKTGSVQEWLGPFTDYTVSTNYRSRPLIIQVANRIIRSQDDSVTLIPHREESSFVVRVLPRDRTCLGEADRIVSELLVARECGYRYQDMAVLCRTNAHVGVIEVACAAQRVPAIVVGGVGFFTRMEVQDCLAYLEIAVSGRDPDVIPVAALDRVYNRPSRYLGAAWRAELEQNGGWARFYALQGDGSWMRPRARSASQGLWSHLESLWQPASGRRIAEEVLVRVIEGMGYRTWLIGDTTSEGGPQSGQSVEDEVVGETLDALVSIAQEHDSIEDLLEFARICRDRSARAATGEGRVNLMTVHRAKGLEFDVVAVAGITARQMPHHAGRPAEERRILYVAVTRARDRLIISGSGDETPEWREMLDALGYVSTPRDSSGEVDSTGDDDRVDAPPGGAAALGGDAGHGKEADGEREVRGVDLGYVYGMPKLLEPEPVESGNGKTEVRWESRRC